MTPEIKIYVQRPEWVATLADLGNSHRENNHSEETFNTLIHRELQ